jgi:pimeloyl-ACP methyl ester carboxylesterase
MTPVYINRCYNVLHDAGGERGVVICGSLGDEGLNLYRSQVMLAERLAHAGHPTLRVSYYGTGDSAGCDGEPEMLRAWVDGIIAGARWLRVARGVTHVTLCGVRIGAVLAALAASELDIVDSLVMLAPVGGRRFLRERILTARSEAEIWQSCNPIDDGTWFEAHGLRLDCGTRDALAWLDAGKVQLPHVRRIFLLAPETPDKLAGALQRQGIKVTQVRLDGYERWLRDSHEADSPLMAFEGIAAWFGETGHAARPVCEIMPQSLDLGTARETPVCLGPADTLAGILAVPARRRAGAPIVLIANTGANPRYGNARGATNLARRLAEQGVASLRLDGYGIGDAAACTGEKGAPYREQGNSDIHAGVDFLTARFRSPVVVLGMCSGAYHAFQAALNDPRINGLILVNLQKFVWQGTESLAVVERTTLRTTGFYLRNVTSPTVWHRLLRGKISAGRIAWTLVQRATLQLAAIADPAVAAIRGETKVGKVRRQFRELSERSVHILYVLSGNDPGLDEVSRYFGIDGWRLRRQRNVAFHTIPRADHTLSTHWAREHLMQQVAPYLKRLFAPTASAEQRQDGRSFHVAPRANMIDSAPTAA